MSFPIYLDENIHRQVATRLRNGGYDVVSARVVGFLGAADEIHLEYAAEQQRGSGYPRSKDNSRSS